MSIKKDTRLIKSKFGQKFLDIFQKSMYEAIAKHSKNGDEKLFYKLSTDKKIPNEVARLLNYNYAKSQNYQSNQNYINYDNIYQLNKYSSDQEFKIIGSSGYQTLQNNLNVYRTDFQKYSPRREINQFRQQQKIWSTGRPRGSLEKFSGHSKKRFFYVEPQNLYVGVQGISLQKHHRLSGTAEVNRSVEKHYEPMNIIETSRSVNNAQLLKAIEIVSKKFGTPFQIEGHREEFYKYISNDKSLQDKLIKVNVKPK